MTKYLPSITIALITGFICWTLSTIEGAGIAVFALGLIGLFISAIVAMGTTKTTDKS